MGQETEAKYKSFLDVSKKVGLPIKKITDFLFWLKSGEPIENNDLVRRLGVSKNAINQVKQSLASILMPVSGNTQLKNEELKTVEPIFEDEYSVEESLLTFLDGISPKGPVQDRQEPLRKYDQFTATTETVLRRAGLLNFLGDVKCKKILFLGDDDFTSIAVASLGLAEQITVLDIDARILNSIKTISAESNFKINTLKYDARNPWPQSLTGKFDTVFTDPPYTPEGINLFMSRSIDALDKKNLAARIYFCYGNSDRAKQRFLPIYESIVASRLMIRYVFDKFNRYHGAESIGNASSLYITEVTPQTKSIIKGKYEKPIYTNN